MSTLIKLAKEVYCLPGPVNIGILLGPGGALIIDSGLDPGAARKVLRALEGLGVSLAGIINTHAHSDHCGGNQELVTKTGARVFAPAIEAALISNPCLEPVMFFGGAEPVKEMRVKFLQAEPSAVDQVIKPGSQVLEGIELEVLPLPGHSPGQIGIVFQDVCFTGDAFFPADILVKHGIPLFADLRMTLETFDYLTNTGYKAYVPGHGQIVEQPAQVVAANRDFLRQLSEEVLVLTNHSSGSYDILAALCQRREIQITNPVQYHLLHTAVLAHLSYLTSTGRIVWRCEDNKLKWQSV
ncbi:MAG: MBL fold metallo-hydrolase [Firmicutes bacterium]|nr:MBL fold metallo-hydrolase [Bacillota bacterium]